VLPRRANNETACGQAIIEAGSAGKVRRWGYRRSGSVPTTRNHFGPVASAFFMPLAMGIKKDVKIGFAGHPDKPASHHVGGDYIRGFTSRDISPVARASRVFRELGR
jgi:hypothetical protein